MPFRSAASKGWMVISSFFYVLDRFDVKLRGDDAIDFHELSIRHGCSILDSGRRGVAGASLHIGDLAYAIFRNSADDSRAVPDEAAHIRFARALCVRKKLAQNPNH